MSYLFFEGRPLTTRGRWINPLVAAHFALEKRLPQLRRVEQPLFILGTGRSGTTILGLLLSMHRDVGFLNEPKALWHSVNPVDDLIGGYSDTPGKYRLNEADVTEELRSRAHKLYGAYIAFTFTTRVVDKYPEMIFRVPFLKAIFPDARFLLLVRNGFDTCHSVSAWSDRLGTLVDGETHDWWGIDRRKWKLLVDQLIPEHSDLAPYAREMRGWTNHIDMAALEWILSMREGQRILGEYPDDVLEVKYEELCSNPRETLRSILTFGELDRNDNKLFDYAEKVLRPAMSRDAVPLHSSIKAAFGDMMRIHGYSEE
jgi:hypothetical protein